MDFKQLGKTKNKILNTCGNGCKIFEAEIVKKFSNFPTKHIHSYVHVTRLLRSHIIKKYIFIFNSQIRLFLTQNILCVRVCVSHAPCMLMSINTAVIRRLKLCLCFRQCVTNAHESSKNIWL